MSKKRKSTRESKSDRRQSKAFTMSLEDTEFIKKLSLETQETSPQHQRQQQEPREQQPPSDTDLPEQLPKKSKLTHANSTNAVQATTFANASLTSAAIEVGPAKQNSIFKSKQDTPKKSEVSTTATESSLKHQQEGVNSYLNEICVQAALNDTKALNSAKKASMNAKNNNSRCKNKPPPMPSARPPKPPTSSGGASNSQDGAKKAAQLRDNSTSVNLTAQPPGTPVSKNATTNDSINAETPAPNSKRAKATPLRPVKSASSLNNDDSIVNKENNNNSLPVAERSVFEVPPSENSRRSRSKLVSYKEPCLNQ